VEARKGLGFLGLDFLEHLSLGGNATWIDATVERTEAELARSGPFFGTAAGDAAAFSSLEEERRLFGQPEWIFNADLTFEHPDWGTRVTLAWFSISDVLDAAGSASIDADGRVRSFTLDRYVDSFDQLDLVASQTWHVDVLRGDLTLKASLKNLTDSTRRRLYDPEQTRGTFVEREFKVGRDYSFSFSYSFSF
jgi:outer membrane receptor protein involved in Fe transport